MRFTKMQGIGNDYIYVNADAENVRRPELLARRMSAPHFGIGADGLVLIHRESADCFQMRMFNRDGSEGEMCGNAARCVGRYVYERGLTDRTELCLKTRAGDRPLRLTVQGGRVQRVQVDMGVPDFTATHVPAQTELPEMVNQPLTVLGRTWQVTCLSMGNPHCVVFVDDLDALDLPVIGSAFEHHEAFPQRVNTEFARVTGNGEIAMRVWERGAGETLACGTGACAVLAAAVRLGLSERQATLHLRGGDLTVRWNEADQHMQQEGPTAFVFDGDWPDTEDEDAQNQ